MTESLPLILEDAQGQRRETHSARLAIRLEGRELWLEADAKGGLLIYVESAEEDTEIPLLVVRPQAVNQLTLSLELEPFEEDHQHPDDH